MLIDPSPCYNRTRRRRFIVNAESTHILSDRLSDCAGQLRPRRFYLRNR